MANMSTQITDSALNSALAGVPKEFRGKLVASYTDLKKNLLEMRHDAAGLCAGKFCEVAIRLLQYRFHGTFTPYGSKIENFADECRKIVVASIGKATESEHSIIPRALVFLYTMRNKRGIGHVGGDVDANSIDLALMMSVADWIVVELIRVYHGLSLEEAQDLVEAIAIRRLPEVWDVAGKKRVLRDGLKAKDEVLLLMYSTKDSAVLVEDLMAWVEYSNLHVFKSKVLAALHSARFLEWDRDTDSVTLSPKGAKYVEEHIISKESAQS
jgi:hypothetical protein